MLVRKVHKWGFIIPVENHRLFEQTLIELELNILYKNNIKFLRKKYSVYQELFENSSVDNNFKIIDAKNGSKTVVYSDRGNDYLIHSKYSPEKEAIRLIKQIKLEGVRSIVVLGFGMGYHLKELYNRVKEKNVRIFVIETNLSLFQEAIKYNDFSNLFSYDNFYLYLNDNYNSSELINFIEDHIDIVFENLTLFKLPTVDRYSDDKLSLIEKDIEFIIRKLGANKDTTKSRGKMWEENLLDNLYLMLNTPGVKDMNGLYKGKPAIVVAAGPSLSKNMHLLKEVKGKAIIIAVDAVLKTLLKNDIIPDIVTVIDGYKHILKYFEGLDYSKFQETVLVGIPQFFNHILEKWPGPIVFSPGYGVNEEIIHWIEKHRGFMGRLPTGGSVAHLSFAVANLLEADPVVFLGQDLAFTDDITHVSGNDNSLKIEEEMKNNKREYMKVKDIHGQKIWTRNDFYFFLQWFNRMIQDMKDSGCKTIFIDATEGGARIEGTEVIPLRDVIDQYCQVKNENKKGIIDKLRNYNVDWNPEIKNEITGIIKNIEILKKNAEDGLLLIDRFLDSIGGKEQKNIMKKLNIVNLNIKTLNANIIFFESEMYKIYDEVNMDFRTDLEKYSKLVDFYNLIINGCKKSTGILNKHYQRILKEGVV